MAINTIFDYIFSKQQEIRKRSVEDPEYQRKLLQEIEGTK